MSAGLWGLGFTLVDMRVRNLLKRLAATPMKKRDFLASWMVVRALLVCIELPILLVFARLAFGVTIQGSLPLLFVVCLLGSAIFAGFGVLVGSRAKNTQTVSGLINLVSMPMYLCSGVFFSAERFPESIQPIVRALPLTALIDSMRGIMTEGNGLREVAPRMAVAILWGIGAFAVALRGFRWR
jgi:ABC-type multidrug transport system permease subunit